MKKDRRQFLRNTTLAVIAMGASPLIAKTDTAKAKQLPTVKPQEDCNPLTQDYYGTGPFYTPNAPISYDGVMMPSDEVGVRLNYRGLLKI